ncbi:MAG: hypothetical protein RML36_10100 [Anaerolineae bacterium]|nr:hypothetical protein [Anaerolineae bacterium]MDW8099819.1 hypothetical protein [Anaerolineae bacterium]
MTLTSWPAYRALAFGPVGRTVAEFARRRPIRLWVLPVDFPWAGAWWFGLILFPRRFRAMPAPIAAPWLAHEITHQMQGRARGMRTPLRGTLYRELEAEIVRWAVRGEIAEAENDQEGLNQARQWLRLFTGEPSTAYQMIRSYHWIYRTPLYRWREPAAEATGWRITLPALGFGPEAMAVIERYCKAP